MLSLLPSKPGRDLTWTNSSFPNRRLPPRPFPPFLQNLQTNFPRPLGSYRSHLPSLVTLFVVSRFGRTRTSPNGTLEFGRRDWEEGEATRRGDASVGERLGPRLGVEETGSDLRRTRFGRVSLRPETTSILPDRILSADSMTDDLRYTYSVCFFGEATQKSNNNGARTSLGYVFANS
jgi:hypothetical protein